MMRKKSKKNPAWVRLMRAVNKIGDPRKVIVRERKEVDKFKYIDPLEYEEKYLDEKTKKLLLKELED